jgi:hypothetical protein
MQTATFIRASLLGPILLPPLASLVPIAAIGGPGLILTAGLTYYGAGYALFALSVLFWLRRPRDDASIRHAVLVAPLLCAPLIAVSVVAIDFANSVVRASDLWAGVAISAGMTIVLGYLYIGLVMIAWPLMAPGDDRPLSSAA